MIDIKRYLTEFTNTDLVEIMNSLESDNDIENIYIILRMLELNLLADLELDELEEEEEHELLEAKKQEEKVPKQKTKEYISRVDKAIESILNQPEKFWNETDPAEHLNGILGLAIFSSDKSKRSALAGTILGGIIHAKKPEVLASKKDDRKTTIRYIKEHLAREKQNSI